MNWPVSQDYNEAVQSPDTSFSDAELRQGVPAVNALGLPLPRSGNFADVYEINCPATGNRWAVKCFTREIAGLKDRYREISAFLAKVNLPFMVDFTYLDQGVRVRGRWFPVLKMRWVEGFTLNEFVKNNLDRPQVLDVLAQIWVKLATRLRAAATAHGDLQHGNVLLVPGSKASALGVKLVDYDGMCVPALTLLRSVEVGHPNYQHPQRAREGIYNTEVDRFPHLVIYTALRSLAVGGRGLWDRYDNGDNLLFRQQDFEAPDRSALLAEILRLKDPGLRALAERLTEAAKRPLDQTPLLEEVARRSQPASYSEEGQPKPRPHADEGENVFASATSSGPGNRPKQKPGGKAPFWIGIAALLVAVAVAGGVLFWSGGGTEKAEDVSNLTPPGPVKPRAAQGPVVPDKATLPPVKSERGAEARAAPEKARSSGKAVVAPRPSPLPDQPIGEVRRWAGQDGFAFSPDGQRLAYVDDGVLYVCEAANGNEVRRIVGGFGHVRFSPDGQRLASFHADKVVRLWDLAEGKEVQHFEGHTDTRDALVGFGEGGRRVLSAAGGNDKTVRVWDVVDGKELRRFRFASGPTLVYLLAVSQDAHRAISGGFENAWRLWDVDTGQELRRFASGAHIYGGDFSPDGARTLIGGAGKLLELWDVSTGSLVRRLEGHTNNVHRVAVAKDGRRGLSSSADGTLRLWDLDTGAETYVYRNDQPGGLWGVKFSPDGSYAMVINEHKSIRLVRLP